MSIRRLFLRRVNATILFCLSLSACEADSGDTGTTPPVD
jgi:hypothetical protein